MSEQRKYKKLSELDNNEFIGSFSFDNCPVASGIEEIKEWMDWYNESEIEEDEDKITLASMDLKVLKPVYLNPINKIYDKDKTIDPDCFSNSDEASEDWELSKNSPIYQAILLFNSVIVKSPELEEMLLNNLNRVIVEHKEILGFKWTGISIDLPEIWV